MQSYTNKIKRIITKEEPLAELTAIQNLPKDYKALMSKNKSFEFGLSDTNTNSFTIWSLNGKGGALEMNEAFDIKNTFGNDTFAIGSDNGDRLIIYVKTNKNYKLYLIEDYDFDLDDSIFLSDTLTSLLEDGQNMELIHS